MTDRLNVPTKRVRTRRQEAVEEAMAEGLGVKDWFVLPGANLPARRHEVWTLLDWYHRRVVVPNRGLRGFLRRIWWRVTGQWDELESPWETIHRKVVHARAAAARREQRAREASAVNVTDLSDETLQQHAESPLEQIVRE